MKPSALISTSTGKKVLMSVSGLVLFLFIIGHMLGNLQVLLGPELGRQMMNEYGYFLKHGLGGENEKLIWIVRGVLLASLILHVVMAIALWSKTSKARGPVGYKKRKWHQANMASLSMVWGGIFLFGYIIFHLLHLTGGAVGWTESGAGSFQYSDVYDNVAYAFADPLLAIVYVVSMVALGLHLFHGSWSLFQTLGVNHPRWQSVLRNGTRTLGLAISLGFAIVPLAVLTGVVKAHGPGPDVEIQQMLEHRHGGHSAEEEPGTASTGDVSGGTESEPITVETPGDDAAE